MGKKWNQRLRKKCVRARNALSLSCVEECCKREKTKWPCFPKNTKKQNSPALHSVQMRICKHCKNNLSPQCDTNCRQVQFTVLCRSNVNEDFRIQRFVLQINQEGLGWGKQTSHVSMSHFSSRNVRKRIDEISELSRDYVKDISIQRDIGTTIYRGTYEIRRSLAGYTFLISH